MEPEPKLELDYPCDWGFTLIGPDEYEIRKGVVEILGDRAHRLELSRRSAMGRYVSLHLEATVRDDDDRHGLFEALRAHPAVRYVL